MDTETLKMEKTQEHTHPKYTELYQRIKLNLTKIWIFWTWNYIVLTEVVLLLS